MNLTDFWNHIDHALDRVETERPATAAGVAEILGGPSPSYGDGIAFFAGSGGDRQLLTSLYRAGWTIEEYHAAYHYIAVYSATGERLEYIEGDLYARPAPALAEQDPPEPSSARA